MIKLRDCTEVSDAVIFETFRQGFSDYYIQIDMTQDFFMDHFFGPEGNTKDMSFIAYDGEEPVGVLLGGIRTLDGIATLRCGGMAVIPTARNKGIAKLMMEAHEAKGKAAEVHQLFLEVLTVNEPAVKFYKRLGYEKVYDLTYRSFVPSKEWQTVEATSFLDNKEVFYSIQKITLMDLEALRHIDESHLPWQGSLEYVSMIDVEVFGAYKNGQLVAGLIGTDKRLFYIYVAPAHRLEGIGKALLATYVQEMAVEKCQFVYTNNARLQTFANHLNMETSEFGQYEYYKWLES